ncbi:unnamed protein product [Caenorhabditis bovis]|uniref:Uncharacterized protein n=1 Tax=Caenorhabditis bovis TaxID=2654633 RepID=A0A8S1EDL5_9PELO|nr:unnamed protein product [Caenorhabditis bovis]
MNPDDCVSMEELATSFPLKLSLILNLSIIPIAFPLQIAALIYIIKKKLFHHNTRIQVILHLFALLIHTTASGPVADEIVKIGQKYKEKFLAIKDDHDAIKALFGEIQKDIGAYIEKQSKEEQNAYKAFIEKKKAELGIME